MQFRVINNKWIQQQEDNALFLNWLYNVDDEEVYKYLLEHCSKHINYLRSKYYNLECFNSIVDDSIMTVLDMKGKVESELHFQNYFKTTLSNRCKNQFIKEKCTMRATESISISSVKKEVKSQECKDSEYEYERLELIMSIRQELDRTKVTSYRGKLAVKYASLVMSYPCKISDREACKLLHCNERTLSEVKKLLQDVFKVLDDDEE